MKYIILIGSLALLAMTAGLGKAQHHHEESAKKPAELLDGLGAHTHPIRTKSSAAQKFFDQGLALIYGFNHDEAARLFARAAELDPQSPMPHWGIALALGPNYNMPPIPEREEKAWKAIGQAIVLSAKAPASERAYVQALRKRYSKDPQADRKKLAVDYKEAMGRLMHTYPDDLDAATLYAESMMNLRPWKLWNPDGQPAEGTQEILSVLENVLRRDPNHPGSNHYYIHAVEASPAPERALASANRLGGLMPGAGHLVHMPSHIYIRTGDLAASVAVNEAASRVDEDYIRRTGSKGEYGLMYYSHNLHFVAYARMHAGRPDEALDYARRLRANVKGAVDKMPMLAPYESFEWLVLITFGKWDSMLAEVEPESKNDFVQAMFRYSRAAAFAGKKNVKQASAERERLQAVVNRVTPSDMLMINSVQSLLAVALEDVDARISRAKGDASGEISHLRRAVELQDALAYMEPPEWHYSMRSALGGALLRAGKAPEAETIFREDLGKNPRQGRSLFGLVTALEKQTKSDSASWVRQEFTEAWKNATLKLTVDSL